MSNFQIDEHFSPPYEFALGQRLQLHLPKQPRHLQEAIVVGRERKIGRNTNNPFDRSYLKYTLRFVEDDAIVVHVETSLRAVAAPENNLEARRYLLKEEFR